MCSDYGLSGCVGGEWRKSLVKQTLITTIMLLCGIKTILYNVWTMDIIVHCKYTCYQECRRLHLYSQKVLLSAVVGVTPLPVEQRMHTNIESILLYTEQLHIDLLSSLSFLPRASDLLARAQTL